MSINPEDINLDKFILVVELMDGTFMKLRAIRPDDKDRLLAFVKRLSRRSRYLRFHHYISGLSEEEAEHFCTVDYHDTMAMVAVIKDNSEENIIAVGRYYRYPDSDRAEVAFVVEDKYQGKGIATHLLDRLILIARENDILSIEAQVLSENKDMQELFQHRDFRISDYPEDGIIKMCLDINPVSGSKN